MAHAFARSAGTSSKATDGTELMHTGGRLTKTRNPTKRSGRQCAKNTATIANHKQECNTLNRLSDWSRENSKTPAGMAKIGCLGCGVVFAGMFALGLIVSLTTLAINGMPDVGSMDRLGLPPEFKKGRAYKVEWDRELKTVTTDYEGSNTESRTDTETRATFFLPVERKVVTNINGKRNTWDADVNSDGTIFRYKKGGRLPGQKENSITTTIEGDRATEVWVLTLNILDRPEGEVKTVTTRTGHATLLPARQDGG